MHLSYMCHLFGRPGHTHGYWLFSQSGCQLTFGVVDKQEK